jgi:hypothetical protein
MLAWHCPAGVIGSLEDALRDITFRALSIAALQHFADTAAEKVMLRDPEPLPHRPTPPSLRAKPERSPRSHFPASPKSRSPTPH